MRSLFEIVEKYNLWDKYVCINQVWDGEKETLYIDGELVDE